MRSGGFICNGCGVKGGDVLEFHRFRYGMRFVEAAKDLGAWEDGSGQQCSTKPRTETAKLGARRLAVGQIRNGFTPEGLHAYRDASGRELYYKIRLKNLATGEKWIRPMHLKGDHYAFGEPEFKGGKPLYGLELLASRSKEIVIICEGEKCADALRKLGLLAITSGSATSATSTDWNSVAGRKVLIWPDHDDAGEKYGTAVAEILLELGCTVHIIDPSALSLGPGEDAADWIEKGPVPCDRKEALRLLVSKSQRLEGTEHPPTNDATRIQPSLADMSLVQSWMRDRCVADSRFNTSTKALYEDMCAWTKQVPFSWQGFENALKAKHVSVKDGFAPGFALQIDVRALAA
jgi:hypothetical protein